MTESHCCPRCGKNIPPDAPADLCPDCLLAGGFLAAVESDDGEAAIDPALARTTPAGGKSGFTAPLATELGSLFPNLEIHDLLGQGGMGAVYRARQTKLDRLVALKIIRPESADNPAFAERFNREARTLARMNHPNIVGVHDFGEVQLDGSPLFFFVMEFVDGANLREVLQGDGVSAAQATMIVGQVCDALQYAHDTGVVHRDIKPENILLDRRGRVKIADFGLARLVIGSTDDFTLTATHQVMGTPRYMAPEQMAGARDVDHRADIYSLGVVFYEMLTGMLPLGSFDPPSAKTGGDATLDRVVLKALAADPQRRYQQVSEFARELYHAAPALAVSAMSVHGGGPQPWPGPSTIMENAIAGAFDRVRDGRALEWLARPHSPAIVAAVLAVGQMVTACLTVMSAIHVKHTTDTQWATPLTRTETPALVAGLAGLGLAIALFAVGSSSRFRGGRPAFIFVATAISSLCLVEGFEAVTGKFHVTTGRDDAILWFIVTLCLTTGWLITAAWDVRLRLLGSETVPAHSRPLRLQAAPKAQWQAGSQPGSPLSSVVESVTSDRGLDSGPGSVQENLPASDERFRLSGQSGSADSFTGEFDELTVQAEADGPSLALIVCGALLVIVHSAIIGVVLLDDVPDRTQVATMMIFGIVAGLLMIFGGVQFRRFSSLGWARIGAVAACVPTGPVFWITLAAGIYANRKLNVPLIRRGFIENTRLRRQQSATDAPRMSRKAIAGAVWAGGFLLLIVSGIGLMTMMRMSTGTPSTWQYGLGVLILVIGMLVMPAPVATPLLGWLAIGDIHRSAGRITGFGLAFLDAVCFPTILLNSLLLLGCMSAGRAINPEADSVAVGVTVALWLVTCIIIDFVALRRLWRRTRPTSLLDVAQSGTKPVDVEGRSRVTTGSASQDSVRLNIQQVEDRNLPHVCMACGEPATESVSQKFAYQTEVAEILTFAGFLLGILPGMLIDALSRRTLSVSCPMCQQHVNHFIRATRWASIGWILLVPFGGLGYLVGNAIALKTVNGEAFGHVVGTITGMVVGLIAWLVPLVVLYSRRIACERITDTHIELRRVASGFTNALSADPAASNSENKDH